MRYVRGISVAVLVVVLGSRGAVQDATKVELPVVAERVGRVVALPYPRLFADGVEFERLRGLARESGIHKDFLEKIVFDADLMVDFPVLERKMEGRRLLGVARHALYRISTLAIAYRMGGREEHLKRAVAEMVAVAGFSDWNPSHFLDTAEMTLALALGYDWLYSELDEEVRSVVYGAIREKGLLTSIRHAGWVRAANNWGQVCHAGIMAGALVMGEGDADLAAEIVHRSVVHLPISMRAYAPRGSYPEGPGYWSYGTDFNVVAIAMLEKTLGSEFGLTSMSGFRESGEYLDLVTGSSGMTFNYADGGMGRGTDFASWWFASRFERPDLLVYAEKKLFMNYVKRRRSFTDRQSGNRLFPLTLFWLQDLPEGIKPQAPLNWSSGGRVPITVHRSSWDNSSDSMFVGVKGGSPSGPHGHMDGGSFVLDAGGIRWAYDIGAEGYHKIEQRKMSLWKAAQDSDRWRIYRLNNHSHNTLVIDGGLQFAKGSAKVVEFSDGAEPYTTLDMSSLYPEAKQVVRKVQLMPDKRVIIQDTLSGLKEGARVRWGMVTKAKPEFADGGGGVVKLHEKNRVLSLLREGSAAAEWQRYEAEKPVNEWDSPNKGMVMVGFESVAPASGELSKRVVIELVK